MIVLKFGGTSVANAQNINKTLDIVAQKSKENKLAVVVSAFSGVTDLLILAGKTASTKDKAYKDIVSQLEQKHKEAIDELVPLSEQSDIIDAINHHINHLKTLLDGCYLLGELSSRTADIVAGFGELLSSQIIAVALKQKVSNSTFKDSRELIKTNANFGKAAVDFSITNTLIADYFKNNNAQVTLLPGFIASSSDGNTTTLGRGGSDYTAAIIAAAVKAEILEIWTDVNGMFTANPKSVKQAQPIETISYQEAMELSHFGAKVLYPPTIQPVLKDSIPIFIKNTFEPEAYGTLISNSPESSSNPIKGITHIDNIALLTLEGSGMIGVAGSSKRLFEVLSNENINVIFITQASSEHSICIGIQNQDAELAKQAIDATFEIAGAKGRRQVTAKDFFVDYFTTAVGPDEILVSVTIPKLGKGWGTCYEKFNRTANGWAIVGVAAAVKVEGGKITEARIGLTNCASVPVRASSVESALKGVSASAAEIESASQSAADGTRATSDLGADKEYREHLMRVLTARAVSCAAGA